MRRNVGERRCCKRTLLEKNKLGLICRHVGAEIWDNSLLKQGMTYRSTPEHGLHLCRQAAQVLSEGLNELLAAEEQIKDTSMSLACQGQVQRISLLLQEALFEIREPGLALCVADLSKERLFGRKLGVPTIIESESHTEREEPVAWLEYERKQLQPMVREESSIWEEYSFLHNNRHAIWVVHANGELVNHAVIDAKTHFSNSLATLLLWLHENRLSQNHLLCQHASNLDCLLCCCRCSRATTGEAWPTIWDRRQSIWNRRQQTSIWDRRQQHNK